MNSDAELASDDCIVDDRRVELWATVAPLATLLLQELAKRQMAQLAADLLVLDR